MQQHFPGQVDQVDTILEQVATLAARPEVNGVVFNLDEILPAAANLRNRYDEWDADPLNPYRANVIAETIDHLITAATVRNPSDASDAAANPPPLPNVRSIVIVGSDSVIPFYRLADLSPIASEADYYDRINSLGVLDTFTPLAGYLDARMFLTDNIYGDDVPDLWGEQLLFVPDRAVGRLVETPEEIRTYLDQYVRGGAALEIDATGSNGRVAVSGYDFFAEQALSMASVFDRLGLTVDTLIDVLPESNWTAEDLQELWFDGQFAFFTLSPYFIQSSIPLHAINAHYEHFQLFPAAAFVNPALPFFSVENIFTPNSGIFTNGARMGYFLNNLTFSMGCQSGLNVERQSIRPGTARQYWMDFPQGIMRQGGNLIGNTGYGYGDFDVLAYTEWLMLLLSQELGSNITNDTGDYIGQPIGTALTHAKQRYVANTMYLNAFDAKAVMQSTLYGLPFLRVRVDQPVDLQAVNEPANVGSSNSPINTRGLTERVITMTLSFTESTTVPRTGRHYPDIRSVTVRDSFVAAGQNAPAVETVLLGQEGVPLLPQVIYDLSAVNQDELERLILQEVTLEGGQFRDVSNYQPQITQVVSQQQSTDPATFPNSAGMWYPDSFYSFSSVGQGDQQRDQLLVAPVQYRAINNDGTQGSMRFYEQVVFRVLYIDPSADDDGITLTIPLVLVPQLDPGELDWTIPGWHEEKIAALLYETPRAVRKELGDIPELAR
ncbi:MAG: DUF3418 domain-containing protein, partial [Chloroflexaceae bacterium]|nr:DUF3418 domain-containing protein [Chloroflexaceae bacterium]